MAATMVKASTANDQFSFTRVGSQKQLLVRLSVSLDRCAQPADR